MSNVQSCFIPTTRNPVKKGTCMSMSLFSSPWLRWDSWAVWKSSYSKTWVGRQKKSLHIMCVLKNRISLISTDGLTRYSVVLIQLILYIYMCMCVWLCMYMQIKGRVAYWATDAALREKWMFPILITLCERVTYNGGSARTKTQHSNCFQVVWKECLTELLATIGSPCHPLDQGSGKLSGMAFIQEDGHGEFGGHEPALTGQPGHA